MLEGYNPKGKFVVEVFEGGTWPGTTGIWRKWGSYDDQANAERAMSAAEKQWRKVRITNH